MPDPCDGSYWPPTEDPDVFNANKKNPSLGKSGSGWGLKELQHCYVTFRSGLDAKQLLKFHDVVPENSIVAEHLRQNLSTDWQGILESCYARQPLSLLNGDLGSLATLPRNEGSYHSSSSIEVQSSPPINQSPSNTSPEQQRKTQRSAEQTQTPTRSPGFLTGTRYSTNLPSSPLARYSTLKGDVSVDQQSPLSSPPQMKSPFTEMASAPRFALSEQPGDLCRLSHRRASSHMDIDESTSQSDYAKGSADWIPQPKLPMHRPITPQRNLRDRHTDKPPLSGTRLVPYSSSSPSIGDHNSPSADSNAALVCRYNTSLYSISEEDKPEKDVEYVARLFVEEVMVGIMAAASSPNGSNPKRWGIKDSIGMKNSKKFEINGYTIRANPDCTISLTVEDIENQRFRDVFLHLEAGKALNCLITLADASKVKKLEHSLGPYEILGQELSELLAEAMRMRVQIHKDPDTIPSWLISWHHLECYFTKLEVTRGYLDQLSDTSGLSRREPPLLRRSRRYNLRIPNDRVEVGLMYARILLELLGEYNSTQKLGVIAQLQS